MSSIQLPDMLLRQTFDQVWSKLS